MSSSKKKSPSCEGYEDSWRRCTCKVKSKQSKWCLKHNSPGSKDPKTGKRCVNAFAVCSASVGKGKTTPCKRNYKGVDRSQFDNPDIRTDYYFKGTEPSPLGNGFCAALTKVGTVMPGNEPDSLWVVQTEKNSRRWRRL